MDERITNNRMLIQKANPRSEFLDRTILLRIKIANKIICLTISKLAAIFKS